MIEIQETGATFYPELSSNGMDWAVIIDNIIVAAFRNSHDAIEFAYSKIEENE